MSYLTLQASKMRVGCQQWPLSHCFGGRRGQMLAHHNVCSGLDRKKAECHWMGLSGLEHQDGQSVVGCDHMDDGMCCIPSLWVMSDHSTVVDFSDVHGLPIHPPFTLFWKKSDQQQEVAASGESIVTCRPHLISIIVLQLIRNQVWLQHFRCSGCHLMKARVEH